MKSIIVVLLGSLLFVLTLFSPAVFAKTVNSSFGFVMNVPDEWFVLTKQEIGENADLLTNAIGDLEVDESILKQINQRIQTGQIELFYLNNSGESNFADNVNVLKSIGRVPSRKHLAKACNQYETELPKLLKKPVTLYKCELTEIAGRMFFYTEYDGFIDNTLNAQYLVQSTENQILTITLTSAIDTFPESKKAFFKATETFRLK